MINKESIVELQKIDCNCNDCIFMVRDLEKYKKSLELHHLWQLSYFNVIKNKLISRAEYFKSKNKMDKHESIMIEVGKLKFQFDKSDVSINYGHCNKLDKEVSFIPNVCQLETQKCFKHRKD